jgi:hypothetical protein
MGDDMESGGPTLTTSFPTWLLLGGTPAYGAGKGAGVASRITCEGAAMACAATGVMTHGRSRSFFAKMRGYG